MTHTILNSMDEVNAALCKGQRVTAYFHVGAFGRSCSEADVKRVINGVAIANFGYDGDSVGLKFSDAKQWVAYDRLNIVGKPLPVEVHATLEPGQMKLMPIATAETRRVMLDKELAKCSPATCGIDLAKPGSEKTAYDQQTIPFIGGPNDGKFYVFRTVTRAVEVPVLDNTGNYRYVLDGYVAHERYKTIVYTLRQFAGVKVYAPDSMSDEQVIIKLIEGYGVKK